jgi:hypothetical protein
MVVERALPMRQELLDQAIPTLPRVELLDQISVPTSSSGPKASL